MKSVDLLRQVRALIEQGWARWYYERTIGGKKHYCLMGAIRHVAKENDGGDLQMELPLLKALGGKRFGNLVLFNDNQTDKRAVLRLIDKAIKMRTA